MRRLRKSPWTTATVLLALATVAASCGSSSAAEDELVLEELVALERAALDPYYGESDPGPYVEQFGAEVTYFDPWTPGRLDGDAAEQHLLSFAGLIPIFRYEILNPAVDLHGDTAVFTFNVETYDPTDGKITSRWNATEVRSRTDDGWEMIHSHWSRTEPGS